MASGKEKGAENVTKLKTYLDGIGGVPARNGKVHKAAILEACGFPRSTLYQNEGVISLIAEYAETKGLISLEPRAEKADCDKLVLERKVTSLETRNSALIAENYELKRKLKQFQHIEIAMIQGKRVDL